MTITPASVDGAGADVPVFFLGAFGLAVPPRTANGLDITVRWNDYATNKNNVLFRLQPSLHDRIKIALAS
jgi:hypothetical protein